MDNNILIECRVLCTTQNDNYLLQRRYEFTLFPNNHCSLLLSYSSHLVSLIFLCPYLSTFKKFFHYWCLLVIPKFTMFTHANLPTFTHVYSCLPMFTLVYLHLPLFSRLPMFTTDYSCLFTYVYPCLPLFTHVYLYLLMFTYVYHCLLVFTYVYYCLLMNIYPCLPIFTRVYLCLLVFSL